MGTWNICLAECLCRPNIHFGLKRYIRKLLPESVAVMFQIFRTCSPKKALDMNKKLGGPNVFKDTTRGLRTLNLAMCIYDLEVQGETHQ